MGEIYEKGDALPDIANHSNTKSQITDPHKYAQFSLEIIFTLIGRNHIRNVELDRQI
jgi:hypothetical protein